MGPKLKDNEDIIELNSNIKMLCDLLRPIADSLQILSQIPVQISEFQNHVDDKLDKIQKSLDEGNLSCRSDVTNTNTLTGSISPSNSNQLIHELQERSIRNTIREEKLKVPNWGDNLKVRYDHYLKYIRCKTLSELYMNYATPVNPESNIGRFLPKKYRPKSIPNEPMACLNIRISAAFDQLKSDARVMNEWLAINQNEIAGIDQKMLDIIKEYANGLLGESLKQLWYEETKKGENNCISIWEEKKKWFVEQENDVNLVKPIQPRNNSDNRQAFSEEGDEIDLTNNIDGNNGNEGQTRVSVFDRLGTSNQRNNGGVTHSKKRGGNSNNKNRKKKNFRNSNNNNDFPRNPNYNQNNSNNRSVDTSFLETTHTNQPRS